LNFIKYLYYTFEHLKRRPNPSFFSIEFNPNFPIDHAIAFPNDGNFWEYDRCIGSSLKAIKLMVDNIKDMNWFMLEMLHLVINNDAKKKRN